MPWPCSPDSNPIALTRKVACHGAIALTRALTRAPDPDHRRTARHGTFRRPLSFCDAAGGEALPTGAYLVSWADELVTTKHPLRRQSEWTYSDAAHRGIEAPLTPIGYIVAH